MKTGPQKEKVTEAQLLTLWWEVPLLSDPNAGGGGQAALRTPSHAQAQVCGGVAMDETQVLNLRNPVFV